MHRLVRAVLGEPVHCPSQFVMVEAHVDVSYGTVELRRLVNKLGFEPDHFLTLNPSDYCECYTLRMEVPHKKRERAGEVQGYLSGALAEIQSQVQKEPGIFAYTELESYSDKMVTRLDFEPTIRDRVRDFPFGSEDYIPDDSDAFKVADVHVKLPFRWSRHGAQTHKDGWSNMLQVRQLLLAAGFYQIQSLSGNAIFTIQTSYMRDAKRAYQQLKEWTARGGTGVTAVTMEAIHAFWRKEEDIEGVAFKSPIPTVVRHKEARDRP